MKSKWHISLTAAVAVVGLLAPMSAANAAPAELVMYTHTGGVSGEYKNILKTVTDFNKSQGKYKVVIKKFPQANYNDAIVASAAANRLPCIMDIDAPVAPAWAYAGYLSPLTVPKSVTDKFQSSAKGFYNGKLYTLGFFEAAIGIFARKSILNELGIRVATIDKPWTLSEFNDAMAKAKASGKYKWAISMGTGWTGEWYPYGYSPLLQSFGGDLIDRKTFKTSEGILNGPNALKWGSWFQDIFAKGYAPKKETGEERDNGFAKGEIAFAWNGSWGAEAAVKTLGSDFVVLPPPALGPKAYIGGGSWQWAISSTCPYKEGANAWLTYAAQTKYQLNFVDEQLLLPVTAEAASQSKYFGPNSELGIFQKLSAEYALIRPATPAYPVIAKIFEVATTNIINGADVQKELDSAVDQIDKNLKDNYYYVKAKSKK